MLAGLYLSARPSGLLAETVTVTCASQAGERQHCAADTSAGVALPGGTEASEKLRKGNYERLFDEARRRVRAWEKENVK
jgi:hypothetical protein